ncbi:hypothetical protein KAU45_03200 [bacterium]|nr:hypothetical protein [bacterium]
MRWIALLLLFTAGFTSATELCDVEPALMEAGYDLATKAAAFYAEEYFPGSSVGPGEPVYDITDEKSVVSWYFIVDAKGEQELSFQEFVELNTNLYKKYLEPFLTGVYSTDNYDIIKYNQLITRYKAILISNYLNYGPLLLCDSHMRIHLSTVPEQISEISREYSTRLTDSYRLYALPNKPLISVCYETIDGRIIFAYQDIDDSKYYEQDNLEELIRYLKTPRTEHAHSSIFLWKSLKALDM